MDCRRVCTREEARQYFKDCGLTYADITEGDIATLMMFLNMEIKKSNKNGETSTSTMHMSARLKLKKRSNGSLISCFLFMNSNYFTQRECISFYDNGYISFCGWADDKNVQPVLRAFVRWCDALKEGKE